MNLEVEAMRKMLSGLAVSLMDLSEYLPNVLAKTSFSSSVMAMEKAGMSFSGRSAVILLLIVSKSRLDMLAFSQIAAKRSEQLTVYAETCFR